MATLFYGILAYFIISKTENRSQRVLVFSLFVLIVILIGLSRIYLQAHYLSDVLAGYAGGFFWLTVCITGLETHKKFMILKKSLKQAKH
jgi:undecaprenyl-diphosphatase